MVCACVCANSLEFLLEFRKTVCSYPLFSWLPPKRPQDPKTAILQRNPIGAYFKSICEATSANGVVVMYNFLYMLRYLEVQCKQKLNDQYSCQTIQLLRMIWAIPSCSKHQYSLVSHALKLCYWFWNGLPFPNSESMDSWWWLVTVCTSSLIFLALKINFSPLGTSRSQVCPLPHYLKCSRGTSHWGGGERSSY